jgi:uncharacterized membrane protein YgdD (TMEM256/DUF423 family)
VQSKHWILIGALAGGLAVVMGAFAAHSLKDRLHDIARHTASSPSAAAAAERNEPPAAARSSVITAAELLAIFETGARYQMYHAIALVLVGLLANRTAGCAPQVAGWAFLTGIVLFSGSLYALVLLSNPRWGMVTPFGGVAFIVGWMALAVAGLHSRE